MVNLKNYTRCVIIAAAPYNSKELNFIKSEINENDFILCADGGFEKAEKIGIIPDLVIGDMDSNRKDIPLTINTIRLPIKKDDTDSMTCIKKSIELGFKEIIVLGGLGGRLDHSFANISALLYAKNKNINITLKNHNIEVKILSNEFYVLNNKIGYTVSIFPFACLHTRLTLDGFEYSLKNSILNADNPIGISNVIINATATISVHKGNILVFILKEV